MHITTPMSYSSPHVTHVKVKKLGPMWQRSSAPGSLSCVFLLPKSFFPRISPCQVLVACGFQFQQPSLWRAFSDHSTWHRSPPSTFSSPLSTPPPFFFYSQHLALWVMRWSIKMLTCMHHAFCFSESKEFIDAFEFLICLLFIAFSMQKSFQIPTNPSHLLKYAESLCGSD